MHVIHVEKMWTISQQLRKNVETYRIFQDRVQPVPNLLEYNSFHIEPQRVPARDRH